MVVIGQFFSTINYSWESVTAAFWRKYPNPFSAHVLTSDTVYREVDDDNCLRSRRLLTKTNKKPKWIDRWVDSTAVLVLEDAMVNPQQRTMVTWTRNITLTKYLSVEERCVYSPSPSDPNVTNVETEARVVSNVSIGPMVERFGLERFKRNIKKASQGLLYVLEQAHNRTSGKIERPQA
jgi:hypothetical protein